jgi:hypothetical protein
VLRRDYPVIQGVVLCIAGLYMLINLLVISRTSCSIRGSATSDRMSVIALPRAEVVPSGEGRDGSRCSRGARRRSSARC